MKYATNLCQKSLTKSMSAAADDESLLEKTKQFCRMPQHSSVHMFNANIYSLFQSLNRYDEQASFSL